MGVKHGTGTTAPPYHVASFPRSPRGTAGERFKGSRNARRRATPKLLHFFHRCSRTVSQRARTGA
jgi:hypothetical protein